MSNKESSVLEKELDKFFPKNKENKDIAINKEQGNLSVFEKIEEQRRVQRSLLLWFSLCIAAIGTLLLVFIVVAQFVARLIISRDFNMLDNFQLEFLGTALLLQVFGILIFITKNLWGNTNYNKDLINEEYKDKRKAKKEKKET
jgi:hypothetical protein